MKVLVHLCTLAVLLLVGGCAHGGRTGPVPAAPSQVVPAESKFDIVTGTSPGLVFHFVGSVGRRETGRSWYEYVVSSTVVLEDGENLLPPGGVRLTEAVLAATQIDDRLPGEKRRTLRECRQSFNVTIRRTGETVALPALRFVIAKDVVAVADYVTLDLGDRRVVVRMFQDLKRMLRAPTRAKGGAGTGSGRLRRPTDGDQGSRAYSGVAVLR